MQAAIDADGNYLKEGEELEKKEPVAEGESELETGGEQEPTPDPEPNREEQLQAQLTEERENRIRLEERIRVQGEQRREPDPEPKKKVYTRTELRTAVTEGAIDEDQMEDIWAQQNREQSRQDTEELLDTRDRKRESESFVDTETDKYLTANPDVRKSGTPDWEKVKGEYDFLIKMGDADSKATELKAMRAAFGANPTRIPERTASHRQTPGESSGSPGAGGGRPVDIWNRITDKQLKSYYKDQVSKGYMTLADVEKNIPYMHQSGGRQH